MTSFFVEMRSLRFTFSSHAGTVCCVNLRSLEICTSSELHPGTTKQSQFGFLHLAVVEAGSLWVHRLPSTVHTPLPGHRGHWATLALKYKIMMCLARTDLSEAIPHWGVRGSLACLSCAISGRGSGPLPLISTTWQTRCSCHFCHSCHPPWRSFACVLKAALMDLLYLSSSPHPLHK